MADLYQGGRTVRGQSDATLHSNWLIKQATAPHPWPWYWVLLHRTGSRELPFRKNPQPVLSPGPSSGIVWQNLNRHLPKYCRKHVTAEQFGQSDHSGWAQASMFVWILASIDVDLSPAYLKRILHPAIMGSPFPDVASAQVCPPLTNKSHKNAMKQIFLSRSNECHWGNC